MDINDYFMYIEREFSPISFQFPQLCHVLTMCFTGFTVHGVLPDSIISLLLVPVIKDMALKCNSMDNYRPIALITVLIPKCWKESPKQGWKCYSELIICLVFKKKHGTDMCIYALNEIIAKYDGRNSALRICFIDGSKVFGGISHENLFFK